MTRTAVYPGTFDPITLGHLDIIRRGARLTDRLVIGVTTNLAKTPMFSTAERIAMVRRETADLPNVEVTEFDSLLMDFAESQGASMILRGLRAVADFEYEYQMAGMNQQINDRIETVFLMADVCLQPIASRLVKEIARYGGPIDKFVSWRSLLPHLLLRRPHRRLRCRSIRLRKLRPISAIAGRLSFRTAAPSSCSSARTPLRSRSSGSRR
jgi:pantetheine-phosphate adenylyltransferase